MRKYEIHSLPYYKYVPKGARAQARFRQMILVEASGSEVVRRQLWQMCAVDPLFFINTFCYTFDPRKIGGTSTPVLPFNTYPFQDETIIDLVNAVGGTEPDSIHDRGIIKSRDMGATWMVLTVFLWFFMFREYHTFSLVSRKEDLVDKSKDPDSLMWKLDFLLDPEHMPDWLSPNTDRSHLAIENLDNHSTINGEATVADAGRGGRRTAMMADEYAAIRDAQQLDGATSSNTNCRLFVSTPKGAATHFKALEDKGKIKFIRLHWTRHPEKVAGLYYDHRGKPHSPWYDAECDRLGVDALIAQELDMESIGSDWNWYKTEMVQDAAEKNIREPVWIGNVFFDLDAGTIEFAEDPHGPMRMWIPPSDLRRRLDEDRCWAMGADVATGKGGKRSTNSVLAIIDKRDRAVIAEFASPNVDMVEFADIATALGRHFAGNDETGQAFICWEENGPGDTFGRQMIKNGYVNFYYRKAKDERGRDTKYPGWNSSKQTKWNLLSDHRQAMKDGELRDPCAELYQECHLYVYGPNGTIVNSKSVTIDDPSGARENNADRVISRGCGLLAMREVPMPEVAQKQEVPRNCLAFRMMDRERKRKENRFADRVGPRLMGRSAAERQMQVTAASVEPIEISSDAAWAEEKIGTSVFSPPALEVGA